MPDVAKPAFSSLNVSDFPEDGGEAVAQYAAAFFSNATARLFKTPTRAPVMKLCHLILHDAEHGMNSDKDILGDVPVWMAGIFDVVMTACNALRSIGSPRPFLGGTKAALNMFSPPDGELVSKDLTDLANTVRSSPHWGPVLDAYWGTSVNDERCAEDFQKADDMLAASLPTDTGLPIDLPSAAEAIAKADKLQVFGLAVAS